MARQLASRLTLALALITPVVFIGCAEEKPAETPAAAPAGDMAKPADAPKEGAAPAGDMAKPAEAPAK